MGSKRLQAAAYIGELAEELGKQALADGLDTIAYLLEMAVLEASNIACDAASSVSDLCRDSDLKFKVRVSAADAAGTAAPAQNAAPTDRPAASRAPARATTK